MASAQQREAAAAAAAAAAAQQPTINESLAGASLNLTTLRDLARRELVRALDTVRGKKALVLDPKLSGPLGLVAEYSLFKEHGVEAIFLLGPGALTTEVKNVVYIARPRMLLMKHIAENIHAYEKHRERDKEPRNHSLFFMPRRTAICERVLEEEGVFAEVQIDELEIDLIPFEDDLLSLEIDTSFREFFLEGDRTSLYYVARSLMRLQSLFGIIPKIHGKGHCARMVADMILRMRREVGADDAQVAPEIDNLVLIDRSVDMITPMCSQLTYEGLIDELYGIQNSYVDLDPAITGQKDRRKIGLFGSDSLYRGLRDKNFAVVGPILNKSAKRINAEYEERHAAKTVSQIREFIGKLTSIQMEHQSLRIHTNIAEQISNATRDVEFHRKLEVEQNLVGGTDNPLNVEYIEELIYKQEPLTKVLRLLCLYSLTSNGLKPKVLESLRRDILQSYGYEKIFTLNNLEKVGLLKKSEGKNAYPAIRKSLRLVVDEINEREPDDIAYVYSGYAPLSVRLVQNLNAKGGWKSIEDALKVLPGPTFEETQALPSGLQIKRNFGGAAAPKVTMVFFLGGCTFTEIAALRFLAQQQEGQRDYIIATTKLINGHTLLESVFEQVDNRVM